MYNKNIADKNIYKINIFKLYNYSKITKVKN